MDISKYKRDDEFSKISHGMPFLRFPPAWEVKIIWPFGGAAARFIVRKGEHKVSVYADFDASLGCEDEPYWEIYPYSGDIWRCDLSDGDALINTISMAIGQQEAAKIEALS